MCVPSDMALDAQLYESCYQTKEPAAAVSSKIWSPFQLEVSETFARRNGFPTQYGHDDLPEIMSSKVDESVIDGLGKSELRLGKVKSYIFDCYFIEKDELNEILFRKIELSETFHELSERQFFLRPKGNNNVEYYGIRINDLTYPEKGKPPTVPDGDVTSTSHACTV
ncbi:hypothetical protein MJT46_008293 [Ovis ammon polii x Ovis aries]|nr:hypothetical protein MJT46_008293 [Ovis ammon polii x Ovis aries]